MCTLQENIVKLRGLDQNLKQELSKLTGVNQVSQMLLRVKMFLPTHTGYKKIFSSQSKVRMQPQVGFDSFVNLLQISCPKYQACL